MNSVRRTSSSAPEARSENGLDGRVDSHFAVESKNPTTAVLTASKNLADGLGAVTASVIWLFGAVTASVIWLCQSVVAVGPADITIDPAAALLTSGMGAAVARSGVVGWTGAEAAAGAASGAAVRWGTAAVCAGSGASLLSAGGPTVRVGTDSRGDGRVATARSAATGATRLVGLMSDAGISTTSEALALGECDCCCAIAVARGPELPVRDTRPARVVPAEDPPGVVVEAEPASELSAFATPNAWGPANEEMPSKKAVAPT